jgi:hypothetical protein
MGEAVFWAWTNSLPGFRLPPVPGTMGVMNSPTNVSYAGYGYQNPARAARAAFLASPEYQKIVDGGLVR